MELEPAPFSLAPRSSAADDGARPGGASTRSSSPSRWSRASTVSPTSSGQAGDPQPAHERGQVHARRRSGRGQARRLDGDGGDHGSRHRDRNRARGPGEDLRVLPAGRPRRDGGGGHRTRPHPVPPDRRAPRRAAVGGERGRAGSTFGFTIPVRARAARRDAVTFPRRRPGRAQAARRPSILLVEDEEHSIDLLSLHLTGAGFAVEVARDGQAGLERADSCARRRSCSTSCSRSSTAGTCSRR